MKIQTRKVALGKKTYMSIAYTHLLRRQWWVFVCCLLLNSGFFFLPSGWWFIGSGSILFVFLLFWTIQFVGVTHLEQYKVLFEKLSYEIDTQHILLKKGSKEGMSIRWDQVKWVRISKRGIILYLNYVQFFYLPTKCFPSLHVTKSLEALLRRKSYIS
ncbi:MAG: YcxB family protein [Cytophagales bacterium]|nr:YcxB family protein [Cytophagales bacterium]